MTKICKIFVFLCFFLIGCPPPVTSSPGITSYSDLDSGKEVPEEYINITGTNSWFGRIQTPSGWIVTFSKAAVYVPDPDHVWLKEKIEKDVLPPK